MIEKKPIRTIIDKDSQKTVGYACGNCGLFFSLLNYPDDAQAQAERCHADEYPCAICGNVMRRPLVGLYPRNYCAACEAERKRASDEKEARREQERFEKARKTTWKDYQGEMVYCDGYGNDGFLGLDEVEELLEGPPEECPDYVWACESYDLKLDAELILQQALEDHHEDAGEGITNEAGAELQKLLDDWCAKQGVRSFEPIDEAVLLKRVT